MKNPFGVDAPFPRFDMPYQYIGGEEYLLPRRRISSPLRPILGSWLPAQRANRNRLRKPDAANHHAVAL